MRLRLIVVFTIPGVLLYLLLGAAYAMSSAHSGQQEVHIDRLADASYLIVTARQSLLGDDPTFVQDELDRYLEVYGVGAAVLDESGRIWASNGLNVDEIDVRFTALAGRRSELDEGSLPWELNRMVIAEPVFEGGDLIGAVVTSSTTDRLVGAVWLRWGLLGAAGLVALALAILIATRLATWVLRPVQMVDDAMSQIQHGEMSARIPESAGPPELRQVIAQFNTMAEKVEQLIAKQQEFVSNASHELRNPLNALLLRVESLAMATPEETAGEMEHVQEEGRRMTRILDALLMLARDGDLGARSTLINLSELVSRRLDGWAPIAAERDVSLAFQGSDGVTAQVDEIVVESAFDAVTDNAIKFSPSGHPVEFDVGVVDRMAEIRIRDHGPGLKEDEIERVTDRFWRSPDHRTVRGSGLGLAIASELLDTCGGELRIVPAGDGGLLVMLRMPNVEDEQ
jgi:signal transduction histidine kinase